MIYVLFFVWSTMQVNTCSRNVRRNIFLYVRCRAKYVYELEQKLELYGFFFFLKKVHFERERKKSN